MKRILGLTAAIAFFLLTMPMLADAQSRIVRLVCEATDGSLPMTVAIDFERRTFTVTYGFGYTEAPLLITSLTDDQIFVRARAGSYTLNRHSLYLYINIAGDSQSRTCRIAQRQI